MSEDHPESLVASANSIGAWDTLTGISGDQGQEAYIVHAELVGDGDEIVGITGIDFGIGTGYDENSPDNVGSELFIEFYVLLVVVLEFKILLFLLKFRILLFVLYHIM